MLELPIPERKVICRQFPHNCRQFLVFAISHITDNVLMFVDVHIVFADICMSDIHLKGNYMNILSSLCAPQGKQSEICRQI